MFLINEYYTRKEIGKILEVDTSGGIWATGYATFNNQIFIFATIGTASRTGADYPNKILDNGNIEWYGKNKSHINQPVIKDIINNIKVVHLFVRFDDKPPFLYLGKAECNNYSDTTPVKVIFKYEGQKQIILSEKEFGKLNKLSFTEEKYIEKCEKKEFDNFDRETLIKSRVGQGYFKERLMKLYGKCCLCGLENKNFLIASHIKPWSQSKKNEKIDKYNGFLLCPHHDAIFDKGYVTFENNGNIIISEHLSAVDQMLLNINPKMKIKVHEKNIPYLEWHRENLFEK